MRYASGGEEKDIALVSFPKVASPPDTARENVVAVALEFSSDKFDPCVSGKDLECCNVIVGEGTELRKYLLI